jgi:hypothetical protein
MQDLIDTTRGDHPEFTSFLEAQPDYRQSGRAPQRPPPVDIRVAGPRYNF